MEKTREDFRKEMEERMKAIGPSFFTYDESEFWMIQNQYEFIENYALENRLPNTYVALPLVRSLHSGSHRKSSVTRKGQTYKPPYVIHCLNVCRILINLQVHISKEEEDVLYASALCHDLIEDFPFPKKGAEIYEDFGFDKRVYEVVKRLSKRKDFTPEEELAHFHGIEEDPLALLVKLADRGNNVEDLYNMSSWKIHEYIGETRKFFLPMSSYGLGHYPWLVKSIGFLENKIVMLVNAAEILLEGHEKRMASLEEEVETLRKENELLHESWRRHLEAR